MAIKEKKAYHTNKQYEELHGVALQLVDMLIGSHKARTALSNHLDEVLGAQDGKKEYDAGAQEALECMEKIKECLINQY